MIEISLCYRPMEAIDKIRDQNPDMVLVTVAHKLNTIRNCDKIFVLEKGRVKESGDYEVGIVLEKGRVKESGDYEVGIVLDNWEGSRRAGITR